MPLLSSDEDHRAGTFRAHLALAGVDRPRLIADNATEEPVDFRSLRDSYATWLALDGVGDKVIHRRMGHATASTTDRYIKAAESLDVDAIGAPFPSLPQALWTRFRTTKSKTPRFPRGLRSTLVARGCYAGRTTTSRSRWGRGSRGDECLARP